MERPQKLLSDATSNTKTRKSQREEFRIVTLSLSPADEAGTGKSNCPNSTQSCRAACVGGPNVGLASVFSLIMKARAEKTRFLQEDRPAFLKQLCSEIASRQRQAENEGAQLVCRLNTFSDLPWESRAYGEIPQQFTGVIFYDYTKLHSRVGQTPKNYSICASWSENPKHQEACAELLHAGHNVAIPFADIYGGNGPRAYNQQLPKRWNVGGSWFEVYDGDLSDLRFLDPGKTLSGRGRICGLRLKAGSNATRNAAIDAGFAIWRG